MEQRNPHGSPWERRAKKFLALMSGTFQHLPTSLGDGVTFKLPLSAHRHFWSGPHEDQHLLEFLYANLAPHSNFFDIGANIGLYSTAVAKKVQARPYCFEPIPSTIKVLRKVLSANDVDAEVVQVALSDREQVITLSDYPDGSNNFWVKDSVEGIPTIAINAVTLDGWCERSGVIPAAMKIDVEGHELAVLKGGLRTISKAKPALLVECHCAAWDSLGVSRQEFVHVIGSFGFSRCVGIKGHPINFLEERETVHLLCTR